jgi:hypothetical protein
MRELLDPGSLHHAATRHVGTHGSKHGSGGTTSTTS